MIGARWTRQLLVALLACALLNVALFARLLHLGHPGGKLMQCMAPPCERTYTLWFALAVFAFVACVSATTLLALDAPTMAVPSNAIVAGTILIAVANLAIDLHYAHPIPHGGKSLNWAMYSDVGVEEQALTPLLSVVVSIASMSLNIICHRTLTDLVESRRAEKQS